MKLESTGHSLSQLACWCVGAPFLTLRAYRGISPARSGRWRKVGGLSQLTFRLRPNPQHATICRGLPSLESLDPATRPTLDLALPCRGLPDMKPLAPATWPFLALVPSVTRSSHLPNLYTCRSWPTLAKPTLAKPTSASVSVSVVWPTLAKTDFGQIMALVFVIGFCVCCVCCWVLLGVAVCCWVLLGVAVFCCVLLCFAVFAVFCCVLLCFALVDVSLFLVKVFGPCRGTPPS